MRKKAIILLFLSCIMAAMFNYANDDILVKSKCSRKKTHYVTKSCPKNTIKSYMDYRSIRDKSSKQYKLQKKAHTDKKTGIRKVKSRYCVAVGSYYTRKIGIKLDLVLSSGRVVKCITADQKSDRHTINKHRIHPDGSVAEFLVDSKRLKKRVRRMGDISCIRSFHGRVKKIRVYK